MTASIEFIRPRETAITELKQLFTSSGVTITSEEEVNKGVGIKLFCIFDNRTFNLILYFNNKSKQSSKIVFENTPEDLSRTILTFLKPLSATKPTPAKPIPVHASVLIPNVSDRTKIKESIKSSGLKLTENKKNDFMDYMIKVEDNGQTLTITQFTKGSLLIQGVYSSLVEKVVSLVDSIKPLTDVERALLYVPEENQENIKSSLEERASIFEELDKQGKSELGEVFDYLFDNDKKTYKTGLGLIEILKDNKRPLPEFNFLVAPFAKVFEGFIIKMMIDKAFFTLKEYQVNPEKPQIGNALRNKKFSKYVKDDRRYGFINEQLLSVWEGTRCKEMHSDPSADDIISSIRTFYEAQDKISGIKDCMRNAFHIIIKQGLTDHDLAAAVLVPTIQQTAVEQIIYSNCVGTDESGKGDYFGPLSVAGVFIDNDDEGKLKAAGVRDSKLISDDGIFEIADKIRMILHKNKYTTVYINPEKYNQLYEKMRNLNRLLAWAHARALENLLQSNNCEVAIADQFGDEAFIKSALMERGKTIKLIQMPKAEQYTAVAAASIFARETFLKQMKLLSDKYKMILPKGASPQVEEVAKDIVKRYGRNELQKIAKLHFKTTDKVLT